MNKRIQELADQIKRLEAELAQEIQCIRIRTYEIRDRTVLFQEEIKRLHRTQVEPLLVYLRHAKLKHVLTAPLILCCLVPAALMDLVVTLYQLICFPVYGIPKVRRGDHVLIDRHHLAYMNVIEKLNCLYCSYFNGVMSYVREIAGRTEQYWCPIKHARRIHAAHGRYPQFFEHGDAEAFRLGMERLRQQYGDVARKQS